MAFLFFFGKDKDMKKKGDDPSAVFYKTVGLDSTQIGIFKSMKDSFIAEMKPHWSEMRKLKDSVYLNMGKGPNDSTVLSLINKMAEKNKEIETKTFNHFTSLRTLCTSDQQTRFDTLVPKFLSRNNRNRR
jgi:hypothetical protein